MRLHNVAFGNLRRRPSRAAFLVAGLLIGIATVVTLLTMSRALTVQAQNQLETYGANIVVAPRTDDLSLSYGGVALGGVRLQARDLREADLSRIRPSRTARTSPSSRPNCSARWRCKGRQTLLLGVRPRDEFELKKWWKLDGRPPAAGDELVAGSAAARRLGLRIGDTVALDGRDFRVTGVLRPTGSQDDELLVTELGAAQALLGKPGKVTLVQVAALCSDCPVEEIAVQLGDVLPGTKVTAMQQVTRNRMHALDTFRTFSYVIAAIIIAIEALVVFVTMMGSVNARTREIGIFRALGFRRSHVTAARAHGGGGRERGGRRARLPGRDGRQLPAAAVLRRGPQRGRVLGAAARGRGGAARGPHRLAGLAVPGHARQPPRPHSGAARHLIRSPP